MKISILLSLLWIPFTVIAQSPLTGTYKRISGETSCTISIDAKKSEIKFQVFAWWGRDDAKHGIIDGKGTLDEINNSVKDDHTNGASSECNTHLKFTTKGLTATFRDCMADNVPDDFSGDFIKVSSVLPGNYTVISEQSYFYTDSKAKRKAFVMYGDVVNVQTFDIGGWAYATYINSTGQTTTGYLKISSLRFLNNDSQ